jgi:hypothetical protein
MNQLFRGINIRLGSGNSGAVGFYVPGAQGTNVNDVDVYAYGAYAGFNAVPGAGGLIANVAVYGGAYGFNIINCQNVPTLVGITLVNQTTSAIAYSSQEPLSLIGLRIVLAAGASSGISTQAGLVHGLTLVDASIDCTNAPSATAIASMVSVNLHNVWVLGCRLTATVPGAPNVPGPPQGSWLTVNEYIKGVDVSSTMVMNVLYLNGVRRPGEQLLDVTSPASGSPPADLLARHIWNEAIFPSWESSDVANAKTVCGATGDGKTDDTAALQACLNAHAKVFLPMGRYRISSTLTLNPGQQLIGVSNVRSYILAATTGFPGASDSNPLPLVRIAGNDAASSGTTLAFVGLITFFHVEVSFISQMSPTVHLGLTLQGVYVSEWNSVNPASMWRANYESRVCECLWLTDYESVTPPCHNSRNITVPKTQVPQDRRLVL